MAYLAKDDRYFQVRYTRQVNSVEVTFLELQLSELQFSVESAASLTKPVIASGAVGADAPCLVWEVSKQQRSPEGIITFAPARYSTVILAPRTVYSGNSFDEASEVFKSVWARTANPNFPLAGGIVGFAAWDAVSGVESISGLQQMPGLPALYLISCERGITLDRECGSIRVWHELGDPQSNHPTVASRGAAQAWCAKLAATLRSSGPSDFLQPSRAPLEVQGQRYNREQFLQMVKAAQDYIVAGDIFQVVLSNSLELSGAVDPLALFERLQVRNRSPYHFALSYGHKQWYVGASPEVMLRSRVLPSGEHEIWMRPVAGTYPRRGVADDTYQVRALAEDPKERAEHLMLVDLERNDIGRTAVLGSVQVSDLFSVESYQSVHHLVSQVRGIIDRRHSVLDALRAAFPIGTLSGTPKVRALEIIAELEAAPRGIFGGAVVTIAPGGTIDSCVAIRAAHIRGDRISIQTGAGIVFDSIPEREFDECLWKARSLIGALNVEERDLESLGIKGFNG